MTKSATQGKSDLGQACGCVPRTNPLRARRIENCWPRYASMAPSCGIGYKGPHCPQTHGDGVSPEPERSNRQLMRGENRLPPRPGGHPDTVRDTTPGRKVCVPLTCHRKVKQTAVKLTLRVSGAPLNGQHWARHRTSWQRIPALRREYLWSDRKTRRTIQSYKIDIVPSRYYSEIPSVEEIENSFEFDEPNGPYNSSGVFNHDGNAPVFRST